ncbi:MAG: hypothetical protein WD646_14370 [Actinomycetota bacterium]
MAKGCARGLHRTRRVEVEGKSKRDRADFDRLKRERRSTERELKRYAELKRAHALLELEHALLKKSHPVHFREKSDVFAFITAEGDRFGVANLPALRRLALRLPLGQSVHKIGSTSRSGAAAS